MPASLKSPFVSMIVLAASVAASAQTKPLDPAQQQKVEAFETFLATNEAEIKAGAVMDGTINGQQAFHDLYFKDKPVRQSDRLYYAEVHEYRDIVRTLQAGIGSFPDGNMAVLQADHQDVAAFAWKAPAGFVMPTGHPNQNFDSSALSLVGDLYGYADINMNGVGTVLHLLQDGTRQPLVMMIQNSYLVHAAIPGELVVDALSGTQANAELVVDSLFAEHELLVQEMWLGLSHDSKLADGTETGIANIVEQKTKTHFLIAVGNHIADDIARPTPTKPLRESVI